MSLSASLPIWTPPAPREILRWPLPAQSLVDRWLLRALALVGRRRVLSISGLDHVRLACDPFILAFNHSSRGEALLVPALLTLYRHGRLIHFLADWNFRLIPGIGLIYRRAEAITVTRKPARPRLLNLLKPLYTHDTSALERAREHLAAGRSVGVFPEGTVNRDPQRLLRGDRGAARLSLQTGVPVVPAGIRFRAADGTGAHYAAMEVVIGAPLTPPGPRIERPPLAKVRAWHARVMTEIGRLCGKDWPYPMGEEA
jgi:1-acyl-sn-glycerol-3-phosphate acyltransferase